MNAARNKIIILGIILYTILQVNGVDKYTDENRPYEFGFSIDGEQHRHEKKDENGLIMGEFGFITADGVYHVTVYATDEQGRFKILSMKNIRVKPYPTVASQNSRKGHSLSLPDPQKDVAKSSGLTPTFEAKQQPQTQITSSKNENSKMSTFQLPPASPVKSCSHCSLPTTTTAAPKYANPVSQTYNSQTSQGEQLPDFYGKQNNDNQNYQNFYQKGQISLNAGSVRAVSNDQDNSQQLFKKPSGTTELNSGALPDSGIQQTFPIPATNAQRNDADHYNQNTYGNGQTNRPSFGNLNTQERKYPQDFDSNISQNNDGNGLPSQAGQNQKIFNNAANSDDNQGLKIVDTARDKIKSERNPDDVYQDSLEISQGKLPKQAAVENYPTTFSGNRSQKRYEAKSGTFGPQNALEGNNQNSFHASHIPEVPPEKPMLISAQMQIVDKNTDIYHKNPGESDGLPEGVSKDYMERVLYVFNYTVGFHGHFEKGYSNGAKQGYYYVTGRNGVRTRVDYEADEKGFRPKISQEVLDLLSDDVPKPETEKEPKYGLKSYEFKWLYFPVGSTQQK